MSRYIAIALLLAGCQTRSTDQIITAKECRSACYPNAMVSVEVMGGSCVCQIKDKL